MSTALDGIQITDADRVYTEHGLVDVAASWLNAIKRCEAIDFPAPEPEPQLCVCGRYESEHDESWTHPFMRARSNEPEPAQEDNVSTQHYVSGRSADTIIVTRIAPNDFRVQSYDPVTREVTGWSDAFDAEQINGFIRDNDWTACEPHECMTPSPAEPERSCIMCNDTGKRETAPCRYCTAGDALVPAAVIGAAARCTRGYPGFCIRHEVLALHEETLEAVTVEYGVADTYFSSPAKQPHGRSRNRGVYGFVSTAETSTGETYMLFIPQANQTEAKQAYRASIQF